MTGLIEARFGGVRATVRRNLAVVTVAVLCVVGAVRSGYGRLTLSALARCLPTEGDQKTRFKRLARFLAAKHFCPESMVPALVDLVLGGKAQRRTKKGNRRWVPILVDQTDVNGIPTLMAGVVHRGRVLPVAFTCYEYAQLRRSQNTLETALLLLIVASLPKGTEPIFVADRAYGRWQLIRALNKMGQRYVLRCKNKVVLWHEGRKCFPKDFKAPWGVPTRYARVGYRQNDREPVDLIVYRERGFKEPWYLLVPAGSEATLPTDEVVRFYRSRMRIEQGFRDWKMHLGVRGVQLETNRAVRMGRLLLALALAYLCLLLMGADDWVQRGHARFETLRRTPRHGTRRTLSVLSLAMLFLAAPDVADRAWRLLRRIVLRLTDGLPAYQDELLIEAAA